MGYKRFDPDSSDVNMEEIVIECYGNITEIAKRCNVHRDTIYEYLKRDPKGKLFLDKARGLNEQIDLDLAEKVTRNNMLNWATNPRLAQTAADRVIDKKGHLRGYNKDNLHINVNNLEHFHSVMNMLKERQSSDLNNVDNNMSSE